jgi:hypothetical protein
VAFISRDTEGAVLEGCKAIADALSAVWRREVSRFVVFRCVTDAHDPLPAWKHRGRLFASRDRVVAWAERQPIWRSGEV